MISTPIMRMASWAAGRTGDAATVAGELNTATTFAPMTLIQFFGAAVAAGADPAQFKPLWAYNAYIEAAIAALKSGELPELLAVIAVMPVELAAGTMTAINAVVAPATLTAGAANWNAEDGEIPTFDAAWVTATLTAAGYAWNGSAWVRS